jgi:hypothetical protein
MTEETITDKPRRKYVRRAPYKKTGRKAKDVQAQEFSEPSAPERPALRQPLRVDPNIERARLRMMELEGVDPDELPDAFTLPFGIEPPGWTYEWKRDKVINQEDPAYRVNLARRGWTPVDASRHPELMPTGYRGVVERDGLVLYERPKELNDRAKEAEYRKALKQVRDKEASLGLAPENQFERRDLKVRRSLEVIAIPESPSVES